MNTTAELYRELVTIVDTTIANTPDYGQSHCDELYNWLHNGMPLPTWVPADVAGVFAEYRTLVTGIDHAKADAPVAWYNPADGCTYDEHGEIIDGLDIDEADADLDGYTDADGNLCCHADNLTQAQCDTLDAEFAALVAASDAYQSEPQPTTQFIALRHVKAAARLMTIPTRWGDAPNGWAMADSCGSVFGSSGIYHEWQQATHVRPAPTIKQVLEAV